MQGTRRIFVWSLGVWGLELGRLVFKYIIRGEIITLFCFLIPVLSKFLMI